VRDLLDSLRFWTGRGLFSEGMDAVAQARAMFDAPFAVASHGSEADPILNYGNRQALALWETDWPAFIAMPSRLMAEPVAREERARFLARVATHGFVDDYRGVRISTRGRRFHIMGATVWNVVDSRGRYQGQAVMFREWEYL
jgi:hypothetical protein